MPEAPVPPPGQPPPAPPPPAPAQAAPPRLRRALVSPLMRRIMLVNALPLVLLVATLLYLDQYQNGLLEAEVGSLREQASIYAGALGESAVTDRDPEHPTLVPEIARPLLRRLTEPSPTAQARLYAPDGTLVADSRVRDGQGATAAPDTPPAAPPSQPPSQSSSQSSPQSSPQSSRRLFQFVVASLYEKLMRLMPGQGEGVITVPAGPGVDWQPDVKEELRLDSSDKSREMPPFIRRTEDNRLLVTVVEPVQRDRHTVGIVMLTRDARVVDDSLFAIRMSILALFTLAIGLTVMLSWYLSLTIARPILRLAGAAYSMREGQGRTGAVPASLMRRTDEVGTLAQALSASATALWARMDATERFAADVAHEIKNPLSSIRSAIETLRRIEDPGQQRRLLSIIADDVARLDRLISDISDASRLDAELSRAALEPIDIAPILAILAEIHDATAAATAPKLSVDAPAEGLVVRGVEDRVVQVLRNLIGNAISFSPAGGTITLRGRDTGANVELCIEDEGPGIPDAKLEHIFDRFYSERPAGEQFGQHSGLGLSISRQIVQALHGRISAENRRDDAGRVIGARFIVSLPKAG